MQQAPNSIRINPVKLPDSFSLFKTKFVQPKAIKAAKILSQRPLKLPEISNPRHSIKYLSIPTNLNSNYKTSTLYNSKSIKPNMMLTQIDNIISECNLIDHRNSEKVLLEIHKSEGEIKGVMNEIMKLDDRNKRKNMKTVRKSLDSEVYVNRQQIKKMIEELRRQTKRIGYETYDRN